MSRFYWALMMLFALPVNAQRPGQDFVVKTSGDTLRGEFRQNARRPDGQTITLLQGKSSLRFGADEISSYGGPEGVMLVSRTIGARGPRAFVRPLALGYVSLYAGTDANGQEWFYLQPADSVYLVKIEPQSAQLTFNRLLSGCPDLQFGTDAIRRKYPLKYRGMVQLVKTYNTCRKPDQVTELPPPGASWRLTKGIKAGLNHTRFDYGDQLVGQEAGRQAGYQAGLLLQVQNRSRFALQLEAVVLSLRTTRDPVAIYSGTSLYTRTGRSRIEFNQVQLPLLLRYYAGNGAVRPYLNAGPCYGFNFNRTTTATYQNSNTTTPETYSFSVPQRSSLGYVAGFGLLLARPVGPSFSLEARYDQIADVISNYDFYIPRHKSFRLDLSVLF